MTREERDNYLAALEHGDADIPAAHVERLRLLRLVPPDGPLRLSPLGMLALSYIKEKDEKAANIFWTLTDPAVEKIKKRIDRYDWTHDMSDCRFVRQRADAQRARIKEAYAALTPAQQAAVDIYRDSATPAGFCLSLK